MGSWPNLLKQINPYRSLVRQEPAVNFGFRDRSMRRLGLALLLPQDRMLIHRTYSPALILSGLFQKPAGTGHFSILLDREPTLTTNKWLRHIDYTATTGAAERIN